MQTFRFVSAVLLGTLLSSPSWAATVTALKGQVSVNRGAGFQPVTGAVQANVGDSIMVSPGGSGEILFTDGCRIAINPGAVVTIEGQTPCTAFAQVGDPGVNPYVVGGVVVLGLVIGGAVLLTQRRSASP